MLPRSPLAHSCACLLLAATLLAGRPAAAQKATAQDAAALASTAKDAAALLVAVDDNAAFLTRSATLQLTLQRRRATTVHRLQSRAQAGDATRLELLAPSTLAGTRMLLRADELRMILPNEPRSQRIRGPALDQGLLGSDLGYADLLGTERLSELYDAVVQGQEEIDGRPCIRVELRARSADARYPRRVLWIDEARRLPLQDERYAPADTLRRRLRYSDVQLQGDRYVAMQVDVHDERLTDSHTELRILALELDQPLQPDALDPSWLSPGDP